MLDTLPLVLRQEMDGPPLEQWRQPLQSSRSEEKQSLSAYEIRDRRSLIPELRETLLTTHAWVGSWEVKRE